MTNLSDTQVRDAALNVLDSYLDSSIDHLTIVENADEFFAEPWTGTDEDGEPVEFEVTPDAEDYARIQEETQNILGFLRDRTDLYYDQ